MGSPITLETAFAGMRQDEPRDSLPNGALWNCVDFIPQSVGSPLRKRGGWQYASPDFGSSYISGMCRTPNYGAGAFNVSVDSNNVVKRFTDGTDTTLGSCASISQNPFVHRVDADTWLVIIPNGTGATTPKSWDGTTFGDLAGTPPQAIFGGVWNDHALLANGTVSGTRYAGRLWFSDLGEGTAWDTANSWYDFSEPIIGIATIRNAILVFHRRSIERLKGTTPATATGVGDLVQDRPFEIGCADARSIVNYNDTVIWADITGVYQTDGIALKNLTSDGGIASFWFTTILNLDTNYTLAAGVVHDTYIISIMNGSDVVDCLCYDLLRGFWFRMQNMPGRCFMRVSGDTAEKVYMGLGNTGRVASLYVLFHPDSELEQDADGTVTEPYFETGFYRGLQTSGKGRSLPSLALQQFKNVFLNWDLRNGGDDPTLVVSYTLDPSSTTYTDLTPALTATTQHKRDRLPIGKQSSGIAFKVSQSGGSTDTRFIAIEAEYHPVEENRLAQ